MKNDENALLATPTIWILPVVVLLVAVLPMPYGYYTILRIVVCLAASFISYAMYLKDGNVGAVSVLFCLVAILFNPIIPVHLSRDVWLFIDLFAAGCFCAFGIRNRVKNRG